MEESDIFKNLKVFKPRSDLNFVTKFVDLKRDSYFGRKIVANNREFSPGDVIAIEKPFILSLDIKKIQQRCGNCLKILNEYTICLACKSIKFCSNSCKEDASKNFHKYECSNLHKMDEDDSFFLLLNRMLFKFISICGNLKNLENFLKSNDRLSFSIFDPRQIDENEKFLLLCCYNLESGNFPEDYQFVKYYIKSPVMKSLYKNDNVEKTFLEKLLLKIMGIINRNSFQLKYKEGSSAGGIFCFASLINHSCDPNLDRLNFENNKMAIVCRKPIKPNEQLTLCYRTPYYFESKEKRQASLLQQFGFLCQCEACVDQEKFSITLKSCAIKEEEATLSVMEEYKRNCTYIQDNYDLYPSEDLVTVINRNKRLLKKFC